MLSSTVREHIRGAGDGARYQGEADICFLGWEEAMKRGKANVVVLRKVNN